MRFKAAYVSGYVPRRAPAGPVGGRAAGRTGGPVLFTAAPVPVRYAAADPGRDGAGAAEVDDALADTVLDVIVRRLEGQGPPAHQVWLPPLDEPPTLDQLLPALAPAPDRGLHAAGYARAGQAGRAGRPGRQAVRAAP